MPHHRTMGIRERLALWVVAAVVGLSVVSSVVLLYNPVDPLLRAQYAPQSPHGDAAGAVASLPAAPGDAS